MAMAAEQDYIKTLHQRELYDGTVRSISANFNLDYIDDSTQMNGPKHRVFGYRGNTPQFDTNSPLPQIHPFSSSIIGWTRPNEQLILLSPREISCIQVLAQGFNWRAKHFYENIFPVIIAKKLGVERHVDWQFAYIRFYIRKSFRFGLYLVLRGSPIQTVEKIMVSVDGNAEEVNRGSVELHLFQSERGKIPFAVNIDRIIDRKHLPSDDNDYIVFGMYCGGSIPQNYTFNNQPKDRVCHDLWLQTPNQNHWYERDTTHAFRTEISYDWQMRRVGYYCSLNALLVVNERSRTHDLTRNLLSLLRESAFIIADGIHSYYELEDAGSHQIREVDHRQPLTPFIAVVPEGVSLLSVNFDNMNPNLRDIYYCMGSMKDGILLNWIYFEEDFTPSQLIIGDPFFLVQHKLKQLMTKEEFWDYMVFFENQRENIRSEIVCLFPEPPNVSDDETLFYISHIYVKLHFDYPYYYYLCTEIFNHHIHGGIFLVPYLRKNYHQHFFDRQIDFTEYPDLGDEEVQAELSFWANEYYQWWDDYGFTYPSGTVTGQVRVDDRLLKSLVNIIVESGQLRASTVNAIMRKIKTRRHYEVMVIQYPNYNRIRPHLERFKQVVYLRDLYDHQILEYDEDRYAFVMFDLPTVMLRHNYSGIFVFDKWDIYGFIGETIPGDDLSHIYHYLGTIKVTFFLKFPILALNYIVHNVEDLPIIECEPGINELLYSDVHNFNDLALQLEQDWNQDPLGERYLSLLEMADLLNPCKPTNLPLRRQTYFSEIRQHIFNFPIFWSNPNRLKYLECYKTGFHTINAQPWYPRPRLPFPNIPQTVPPGFPPNLPQGFRQNLPPGFPPNLAQGFPPNLPPGFPPHLAPGYRPNVPPGFPPNLAQGFPPNLAPGFRPNPPPGFPPNLP